MCDSSELIVEDALQSWGLAELNEAAELAGLRPISDEEYARLDEAALARGAERELLHTDDETIAAVIAAHNLCVCDDFYEVLEDALS